MMTFDEKLKDKILEFEFGLAYDYRNTYSETEHSAIVNKYVFDIKKLIVESLPEKLESINQDHLISDKLYSLYKGYNQAVDTMKERIG